MEGFPTPVISKTIKAAILGLACRFLRFLTSLFPQTSKNRKYARGYLGNYQRQKFGISNLDSEKWDLKLRFRSLVRSVSLRREYATPTLTFREYATPTLTPQGQACGAPNSHAR